MLQIPGVGEELVDKQGRYNQHERTPYACRQTGFTTHKADRQPKRKPEFPSQEIGALRGASLAMVAELDEEQQEELLEAMDELDITPIGLKKGLKGGSVGLMSAVGGSGVATASNPDAVYNYIVDWGDGSSNQYNDGDSYANNKDAIFHTYENEGIYQVQITGNFRRLYANAESESNWIIDTVTQTDKDGVALGSNRNLSMMYYLTEIRNFGNTLLNNCAYGFCRCTKLTTLPSDLSTNAFADVTSFDHVFYGCTSLASLPYDEVFEVGLFSNCTKCTSVQEVNNQGN